MDSKGDYLDSTIYLNSHRIRYLVMRIDGGLLN